MNMPFALSSSSVFKPELGQLLKIGLLASCPRQDPRYDSIHFSIVADRNDVLPIDGTFATDLVQWYLAVFEHEAVILEVILYAELFINDVIAFEQPITSQSLAKWERLVRQWYDIER